VSDPLEITTGSFWRLPNPAGPAPLRRPGSVRRTSTIDVTWPEGRTGPQRLVGRARDILTPRAGGAPVVLAEDAMTVLIPSDRIIREITSEPPRPELSGFVGVRLGAPLRTMLQESLPQEREAGTPLHLMIDDLPGASLVSGWAWSRWIDAWKAPAPGEPAQRPMEGVCIGFRPGSAALLRDGGTANDHRCAEVPPLTHPDDPDGWHAITEPPGVSMRRARRIDVRVEDGVIRIHSGFQDSASAPNLPAGHRVAVHEYVLEATADLATGRVLSLAAEPRVLPFRECIDAPGNIERLLDASMRDLRPMVLEALRKTLGCTHLNDALRMLSDAPLLAQHALTSA